MLILDGLRHLQALFEYVLDLFKWTAVFHDAATEMDQRVIQCAAVVRFVQEVDGILGLSELVGPEFTRIAGEQPSAEEHPSERVARTLLRCGPRENQL